ncbi:bifunctional metallophosphatase/5'-nucleotidase [Bifidobacterium felsineum]|uniref:bifunctional metallophosphatase/5'-nucleotidase n=1 Tax=Bifidobacterium felsineum TaxID=2045440 RepID=UPI001BDBD075|nr:5'-nucleotidase C-terminal domain-containing protein [Bifidobacterium felsineum]MBT1163828.1 bifunctional metallophosphatase/5'-nucleotidase [Bifidobacterium felsineum]
MNRRHMWSGRRPKVAIAVVIATVLTILVIPNAVAGASGTVPFSGNDAATGTRTVTIADITDFHGHIERGADNAAAFTLADSHNPGNMVPVSTGDLVGGSPYESAVAKDQPTLDMAKSWGLTISAVGNHEFDRSVADFNNRIASPANGIDWLCANISAENKASGGRLSRVKDYTIREVNGKRIGFVGALTDALGSVATPQITKDADLDKRAVDAVNQVAHNLKQSGKVDAVVALIHADATAAQGLGKDVDVAYTGHTHALKYGTTDGGAPIYEAGSFGRAMAVQDLVISGYGRRAKVTVENVDLGNGTEQASPKVPGVIRVEGLDAHTTQSAWMSAGSTGDGMVDHAQHVYTVAQAHAEQVGSTIIGTLANGTNFDKRIEHGHEDSVGQLVADANRAMIQRKIYAGQRLPVIGFSNDGSLRTGQLDLNGDGKVSVKEVDSLMALQFKAAHETLTGKDVKDVLAEQFRFKDDQLKRRWIGISSNVGYRFVERDSNEAEGAGHPADTDFDADNDDSAVAIVDLTIDGKPIADDDLVIVASNSYLLQGGDDYHAFRTGTNYGELNMPYSEPLKQYLAAHPALAPKKTPLTGVHA